MMDEFLAFHLTIAHSKTVSLLFICPLSMADLCFWGHHNECSDYRLCLLLGALSLPGFELLASHLRP